MEIMEDITGTTVVIMGTTVITQNTATAMDTTETRDFTPSTVSTTTLGMVGGIETERKELVREALTSWRREERQRKGRTRQAVRG